MSQRSGKPDHESLTKRKVGNFSVDEVQLVLRILLLPAVVVRALWHLLHPNLVIHFGKSQRSFHFSSLALIHLARSWFHTTPKDRIPYLSCPSHAICKPSTTFWSRRQ